MHRSHLHSYTLMMKNLEEKLRKTLPFTLATKRIKYLGINLPKETKGLYAKNYKVPMKEIKGDTNRWRYTMFSDWKNQYCENDCTTEINLQIQCNPYETTNGIFHRIRTKISQFLWKHRRPRIAKAILR